MLIKVMNDKIENIRQVCLEVLEKVCEKCGADGKALYEQILPTLISRLN